MVLPAEVKTCLFTYTALKAVIDAADPDREPEGEPIEGAIVSIVASVPRVVLSPHPNVMTIALEKIEALTNASGVLVGPDGLVGVRVVATDTPEVNPVNFTYNITITGVGTTFSFNCAAPGDTTVDLSTVTPIKASTGVGITPIVVGLPVPGDEGDVSMVEGGEWVSKPIPGSPQFISATAPVASGPYAWWDTSEEALTLWIEDGV